MFLGHRLRTFQDFAGQAVDDPHFEFFLIRERHHAEGEHLVDLEAVEKIPRLSGAICG